MSNPDHSIGITPLGSTSAVCIRMLFVNTKKKKKRKKKLLTSSMMA